MASLAGKVFSRNQRQSFRALSHNIEKGFVVLYRLLRRRGAERGSACRHRFRIPCTDPSFECAGIREERRPGGAESEYAIFEEGLAAAYGGKEVPVMLEVSCVGRVVCRFAGPAQVVGIRGNNRIFFAVLLEKLLAHGLGERVDSEPRLLFARHL